MNDQPQNPLVPHLQNVVEAAQSGDQNAIANRLVGFIGEAKTQGLSAEDTIKILNESGLKGDSLDSFVQQQFAA